jgi:acetyl esterase/lipase
MSFARRRVVTAALTANAIRPVPGYWTSVPVFLAGWLTSELAPHLLALTVLDTARELTRRERNKAAIALGVATAAGLGTMVAGSRSSVRALEGTLEEGLGADYRARLAEVHDDLDPATPWTRLAWPFRMVNPKVDVRRDVVYDQRHGRRGRLDVYRPKDPPSDTGAPVLLQVHGGGWYVGSKEQQGVPLMMEMAAAGWVCVAINYRLSPRGRYPDHLVDVKRAIAWVREHGQEHGADPSFIAITGGSAGGHLAALAALTPNRPEYQPGFEDADTAVQAAVPHYGVYDLAGITETKAAINLRDRFVAKRLLFAAATAGLEPFRSASPILQVNPDAPPFYVIHGTNDSLVGVQQARAFVSALRRTSKEPVLYTELKGTQHAFDIFPSIRSQHVVRAVDRFLRWSYAESQRS